MFEFLAPDFEYIDHGPLMFPRGDAVCSIEAFDITPLDEALARYEESTSD